MKVLFLAYGMLPVPGIRNFGPDSRTEQIDGMLRALGHEVVTSCNCGAMEFFSRGTQPLPEEMRYWSHTWRDLPGIIREADPDVVYCAPYVLGAFEGIELDLEVPLILENGGSVMLEMAFDHLGDPRYPHLLTALLRSEVAALRQADHLVTYGERQRYYAIPFATLAGWDVTDEARVTVLRHAVPDERIPAERGYPDEPVFAFVGGFHHWLDPYPYIHALIDVLEEEGRGEFRVYGGWHADHASAGPRIAELRERMAGSSRCSSHESLPMEEMDRIMREELCISVETMGDNFERSLALPYRTTATMAAGMGLLCSSGFEMAREVEGRQAGWVVTPGDLEGLRSTVRGILREGTWQRRCRNATGFARDNFSYSATVPILGAVLAGASKIAKTAVAPLADGVSDLSWGERHLLDFFRRPGLKRLRHLSSRLLRGVLPGSGFKKKESRT